MQVDRDNRMELFFTLSVDQDTHALLTRIDWVSSQVGMPITQLKLTYEAR